MSQDEIGRGRPKNVTDSVGVPIHHRCPDCGSPRVYVRSHPFVPRTRILRANYCNRCGWQNPALAQRAAAQ